MIEQLTSDGRVWDYCIVGTGPVGMALALELERLDFDVLVIESGDIDQTSAASEASRAEIVDPDRHADMKVAVCRALGGTSWTWGGRCVIYDEVDWIPRDFVDDALWPITEDEISPWYKRAAEYLLCGNDTFFVTFDRKLTDGLTIETVERWARDSRVILEHRGRLLSSQKIKISLKSTVSQLNFNAAEDSVNSLTVVTESGPIDVKVRTIVLAMGGIETTRLLLYVQQSHPTLFGGLDGPLGRYYMGHISGKIASIAFDDLDMADVMDFKLDDSGSFYRRRFMLTTEAQVANKLLNTAFWPDNPPFYDPGHKSSVLSSVFLALVFPPIGRLLLSEGIRLAHTGQKPYRIGSHLKNALLGAPRGAKDIYRILRDRFIRKPKKPGFLVPNRGGKYALHYHAEQVPNRDSRITLGAETDAYGVPRAIIDLRFMDQDVKSVIDSHAVLDTALRANGIGKLEYWYDAEELLAKVDAQAADGYHQVGTTRMGTDPKASVVGSDLKVHGIGNLYIASSSVFPTSGQANSTLLAVALAMRLADSLSTIREKSGRMGGAR
jgi:choline dehydrogenase-like flavoprotein